MLEKLQTKEMARIYVKMSSKQYYQIRIDRNDQQGIFNTEIGTHTHKLRLIKSIT